MLKGTVIMLLLLFASTVVLAFNVRLINADGQTVYINADGSITPAGAPIATSDNITYFFTGDIKYPAYNGIIVQRGNVVINGNGCTLQGAGGYNNGIHGVYITKIGNVTIENTTIENFDYGVELYQSNYNNICRNNLTANYYCSIELHYSWYDVISDNNATANTYSYCDGIDLNTWCQYNNISDNNATGNQYAGINLWQASNNIVSGNNATANGWAGIEERWDWTTTGVSSNVVRGNNASANRVGIELGEQSCSDIISGNNAMGNSASGIAVELSDSNTVSGNNVANNHDGIMLTADSSSNVVSENTAANNYDGIVLAEYSYGNVVSENTVLANNYGIVPNSSSNTVVHNNFVNNTFQVSICNSTNTWDDGYPLGGNYWSDYNGTDSFSGQYQNVTGSDGIGDTPYPTDNNNTDNYPLMGLFSNLYSEGTQPCISCISNSSISGFQLHRAAISFDVSGQPNTSGFCTVTISHSTLLPTYSIEIDSSAVSYTITYEDTTQTILYFTYEHSTHEVTITGVAYGGAGGRMPYMD
jgi:parallel beta-helix repeat protein